MTLSVKKSSLFPASKTQSGSHSKTSTHAHSREHTQTQYAVRTMSTDTTRSLSHSLLPPSLPRSTFSAITSHAVQFYLHQPLISGTAAQRLPMGEDRRRYCLYLVVEWVCTNVLPALFKKKPMFRKDRAYARLSLQIIEYSHTVVCNIKSRDYLFRDVMG